MTFDFKSASKQELKAQYDLIASEMGDDQFFTKKELYHLPSVLADGEQVLAFTSGLMNGNTWLIALTDRRILFLDKGMIYGLKQASIDLDKVNAVSGKTGIFFGTILIEDGATQREITNVWKKTVIKFTNKVRDAMEARKNRSMPQNQGGDLVSMLERLANLKERGIITDEEFHAQKSRLLAG